MKSILFISLIFITFLSSCGKYEEGPNFSLRTKKNRLISHWKIHKYYVNDYLQGDYDFHFLLHGYGIFHFGYDLTQEIIANFGYDFYALSEGNWELTNNKEVLRLRYFEEGTTNVYKMEDWRILKLEKNHMVLSREDGDDLIRMEFVRQGDSDRFKNIKTY